MEQKLPLSLKYGLVFYLQPQLITIFLEDVWNIGKQNVDKNAINHIKIWYEK